MKSYIVLTTLCTSLLLFSTGCDRAGGEEGNNKTPDSAAESDAAAENTGLHGLHDGWWCGAHGIPEQECAMCNRKLATKYFEEGDWCDEHSRPDSLCFKCHPENAEKFAKAYVDRFGEEPPERKD